MGALSDPKQLQTFGRMIHLNRNLFICLSFAHKICARRAPMRRTHPIQHIRQRNQIESRAPIYPIRIMAEPRIGWLSANG
jgi:hypothetical protein